ncbi:hypothetical protein [Virgibacillus siamensis]|uniref:hypothetical protein n=1 Tax=Virgibacillus siamensis TaxID=480071 RepID=UPI0009869DAF|nr:hypothetical protein [Virgibacillus siamensis]
MEKKEIYLLLTDTGTLFTKTIKLYTKNPFNHASIAFDGTLTELYSFGRKNIHNPFIGGFVKENIHDNLMREADCAIYSRSIPAEQCEKMINYIQKIKEQQDQYRYNLLGLFAIILRIRFNRENAFFCSQFIATVLAECGVTTFPKPPSLVTPHDLPQVAGFQLVYRGKLSDFHTHPNKVNRHIQNTTH